MTYFRNKKYKLTAKMIQALQHLDFRQKNPDCPAEQNPYTFNRSSVKSLYTRRLVEMPDLNLTDRGHEAIREINEKEYYD